MKILWSWLHEIAPAEASPHEVARRLTLAGFEVESLMPVTRNGELQGDPTVLQAVEEDFLLEVAVTPNRPDCLSILGLAREVAVLFDLPKLRLESTKVRELGPPVRSIVKVQIECPDLCGRYMGRLVGRVKVGPSPAVVAYRLRQMGIRPLNNVVDATNYVLLERGQPLHAFDLDELAGKKVTVRRQVGRGEFIALDGQQRILEDGDILICDAEKTIAMGGIMGGVNSGIREETREVFIESAYFTPSTIRRTSKRLRLQTESSYRFERGVDIRGVESALDRAACLIARDAGGEIAQGRIDVFPGRGRRRKIVFDPAAIRRTTGVDLKAHEGRDVLTRLGCGVARRSRTRWDVSPPSWRVDLEREVDLVEEVMRIKGFDRIPSTSPEFKWVPRHPDPALALENRVRELLAASGFQEAITTSFIPATALEPFGVQASKEGDEALWEAEPAAARPMSPIEIRNPLSEDQRYMRPSLLPTLLPVVAHNLRRGRRSMNLFEMGIVYFRGPGGQQIHERSSVIALGVDFDRSPRSVHLDMKGRSEELLGRLGVGTRVFQRSRCPSYWSSGETARIAVGDEIVGMMGAVADSVRTFFEIEPPVYLFELHLDVLCRVARPVRSVSAYSRFPTVTRDLSLVLDEAAPYESVVRAMDPASVPFLDEVRPSDEYRGHQIPAGKKGISVALRFVHPEKTLTEEEVNLSVGRVMARLAEAGIGLRESKTGV